MPSRPGSAVAKTRTTPFARALEMDSCGPRGRTRRRTGGIGSGARRHPILRPGSVRPKAPIRLPAARGRRNCSFWAEASPCHDRGRHDGKMYRCQNSRRRTTPGELFEDGGDRPRTAAPPAELGGDPQREEPFVGEPVDDRGGQPVLPVDPSRLGPDPIGRERMRGRPPRLRRIRGGRRHGRAETHELLMRADRSSALGRREAMPVEPTPKDRFTSLDALALVREIRQLGPARVEKGVRYTGRRMVAHLASARIGQAGAPAPSRSVRGPPRRDPGAHRRAVARGAGAPPAAGGVDDPVDRGSRRRAVPRDRALPVRRARRTPTGGRVLRHGESRDRPRGQDRGGDPAPNLGPSDRSRRLRLRSAAFPGRPLVDGDRRDRGGVASVAQRSRQHSRGPSLPRRARRGGSDRAGRTLGIRARGERARGGAGPATAAR